MEPLIPGKVALTLNGDYESPVCEGVCLIDHVGTHVAGSEMKETVLTYSPSLC